MRKPIYKCTEYTDLKDMLKKSGERFGDRPAYVYKTKEPGNFKEITHREFREDIDNFGTALINLGLKGKRIAVISDNRYELKQLYILINMIK